MQPRRNAVPIIVAVLLVLPVVYMGRYLALVLPAYSGTGIINSDYPLSHYRVGGVWSEGVF